MIEAVKQSVGSILSSGLTTVTGFLAGAHAFQNRAGYGLGYVEGHCLKPGERVMFPSGAGYFHIPVDR